MIFENFFNRFRTPTDALTSQPRSPFHSRLDHRGMWLDEKPRLLVVSGSGISVASGVPTYRADNGLWLNHSLDVVCNLHTWKSNIDQVQHFYQTLWDHKQHCQPNLGHQMLDGLDCVHFTQNVDGLAAQAIPLHGQLSLLECMACGAHWPHGGTMDLRVPCPECHTVGNVKPGVVFFHQHPPMYQIFLNTLQGLRADDVLVVVGTSGSVVPIVSWCHQLQIPSQKWLFNFEPSVDLPADFFHHVVMGPFEQTCFALKNQWEKHLRAL